VNTEKDGHENAKARKRQPRKSKPEKEKSMLRIASVLDDVTEALITRIIGICIAVHRELGPGLLKSIYRRAICLELETAGLSFEVEKQVPVLYRGIVLCHHRLDIVVDLKVLLEIKAVERLAPIHHAQVLSYLRISKLPVALLMNFNSVVLPDGLKRIVL
jgi:GxxExxY protein